MTFQNWFLKLDHFLYTHRQYWQCVPFEHEQYPWAELAEQLDNLSDDEVSHLDGHFEAMLNHFSGSIPDLAQLPQLLHLPKIDKPRAPVPFWLSTGIKGRKLEQLQDFISSLGHLSTSTLEWCAGKGHLGRMMSHAGASEVNSVELQPHLCEQGQHSADKQGLNMHFHCLNVLTESTQALFSRVEHGVALHACGRLHQTFMENAVAANVGRISLSPCCYHLFTEPTYQGMSFEAQQSQLQLSHHDMKLALQETVTAPKRVGKVRKKEVAWRLGFDALRRDITGVNEYVSVPSVNKAIFSGEFSDFCLWAAKQKQINLPEGVDFQMFLARGEQRKFVVDRIELVRHIFRRAIELWLVLDRALYLEQSGYQVSISEFCDKSLTPRNILIQAHR